MRSSATPAAGRVPAEIKGRLSQGAATPADLAIHYADTIASAARKAVNAAEDELTAAGLDRGDMFDDAHQAARAGVLLGPPALISPDLETGRVVYRVARDGAAREIRKAIRYREHVKPTPVRPGTNQGFGWDFDRTAPVLELYAAVERSMFDLAKFDERRWSIVVRYAAGETLDQIGKSIDLSVESVRRYYSEGVSGSLRMLMPYLQPSFDRGKKSLRFANGGRSYQDLRRIAEYLIRLYATGHYKRAPAVR